MLVKMEQLERLADKVSRATMEQQATLVDREKLEALV